MTIALRAGAILLGVCGLFFAFRGIFSSVPLSPLHADDLREGLNSKRELRLKIDELEMSLGEYRAAFDQAELLRTENESLKAELNRTFEHGGTLARVLLSPERTLYDTMIIDAGSKNGVVEGQVVYAFGSIALGTISRADVLQSTVLLFSAPDRQTVGTAEGSDVAITLIGRGTGEFEVRMPRDVHFTVGELVSYPSVATAVLAKVERIITDPRDPFQRLLAKAPVNLNALKFVVVR